ncbi:MAG: hypothetical protein HKN74_05360 [Acidimicrobiia bacterium]|nr:hypothetical protein [Acidimicrobiia bacterium]MBT8216243.1 hypothetical protein [Acidimicrobiia bacterium]NNF09693.1 hypothetical protein [Acidimicrobiia bacterium]NNL68820.1 hypothetical protein [Acidimicrobiia bacterium]
MAGSGLSIGCVVRSHLLAADPGRHDAHIDECLRCQAEAARYRTMLRSLAALQDTVVPAPAGLASAVGAHIGGLDHDPRKAAGREVAVAAAGVVAVASALALWRRTISA